MNEKVKKAKEIDQFKQYIPELEVGETVELNDLWDGAGEIPTESYSYQLTDAGWINYNFEVIEEKENPLDTIIKITSIELI